MSGPKDGGPAFPGEYEGQNTFGHPVRMFWDGMSLHEWFAGQALSNPAICTGKASEWEMRKWFGERCGITHWEICAAQANEYADAMLKARDK